MQVNAPVWTLKQLCPVCGQGTCLVLVNCPRCRRLAVHCDEEGSDFPEPRDLSSTAEGSSPCPGCGEVALSAFAPASDESIRAFGFTAAEYE
jgi:hypothetical protein